jgi:hypothetical protein
VKALFKILIFIVLVAPGQMTYGQSYSSTSDPAHIVRKNDKSVSDSRQYKQSQDKKLKKNKDKVDGLDDQALNNAAPDNMDKIKRINSARPDMTRVRGARPPDIMRPSGSLMPRGIGKPGGAFRPGGH